MPFRFNPFTDKLDLVETGTPPPGTVTSLTGNNGGSVGPSGSGTINVIGTGNILVSGSPGTFTETITLVNTTNHAVQVGNSIGALASLALGTAGQVLTSQGPGLDPVFASVTAGLFPFTDEAVNFAAVSNNGYFCSAPLTATLPAAPAQGDTIVIQVDTAGAVIIQANAGQSIRLGTSSTSVAGTKTSTAVGDSVTITYRTADTTWHARGVQGNWLNS